MEGHIFQHLADNNGRKGVDHHIIPLLDSFEDDREPSLEFFVMPFLAACDDPPFERVDEVIDLL